MAQKMLEPLPQIQLFSIGPQQVEQIASLESRLNNMRLANDEELVRINNSIDLEEIKRIAIGELGMTYATEGQIINYTNESSDYVRQFGEIPGQ